MSELEVELQACGALLGGASTLLPVLPATPERKRQLFVMAYLLLGKTTSVVVVN